MEMKIGAERDIVLLTADARVCHANPLEAANQHQASSEKSSGTTDALLREPRRLTSHVDSDFSTITPPKGEARFGLHQLRLIPASQRTPPTAPVGAAALPGRLRSPVADSVMYRRSLSLPPIATLVQVGPAQEFVPPTRPNGMSTI
jgi:hypothetical protein